jgi:1-acyl-sn-glycerol-3-phosphate acyltransferase
MLTVKTTRINAGKEVFEKPAVIIANHQSFVDILLMLSMYPKIIMLTNNWVWKSPFFGKIVQYADYYHTADGYESLVDRLKERVAEGYSILVFPEGTRSADCSILRFHKGAFYLAEQLGLDILPVMIYGAGQICAKKQGFYIKSGKLVAKVLDRVPYGSGMMGDSYQEQAKRFRAYFIEEYNRINSEYGVASNPYFRDALIKNYIYKGPVLEWYMRIKCRIDGFYELWDRLVPRNAIMTDVGCGYGQMCYMLSMLSPERVVCGLDYDEDKISLANHCFLRKANISFLHADMVTCQMPQSDVFLFNDSLHYVCEASQKIVLEHCLENLNPGGMLIVRDGDATNDNGQRHIEETEVWSTKIIGFNKTVEELTFLTKDWMKDFANEHNLEIKIKKCDEKTSETLYILRRKDI